MMGETLTLTVSKETAAAMLEAMEQRFLRASAFRKPRRTDMREAAEFHYQVAQAQYHELLDVMAKATGVE